MCSWEKGCREINWSPCLNIWWDLGETMHSFHMWYQGFISCKAVLHTAGSGQLPLVALEVKAALPHSCSSGQRGFSAVDYSGGDIIQVYILTKGYCSVLLGVLLCQELSHNLWECPSSLFLKGRFLFTFQLQAGSAHRFIWGWGCMHARLGFFWGCCVWVFCF